MDPVRRVRTRTRTYRKAEQRHFRRPLRVPDHRRQGRDRGHVRQGEGDQTGREVSGREGGIRLGRGRC